MQVGVQGLHCRAEAGGSCEEELTLLILSQISNPVEKQHSMASQERTILQESKSFDVFCTCLLKAGGREMGSGPPADPHPIALVYGERQDSRQCTVPRAGSPARA